MKEYQETVEPDQASKICLQEVIHFQAQRMMRYRGQWHLEKKDILPGYVFLSGTGQIVLNQQVKNNGVDENNLIFMKPCESPFLKCLCQKGNLVQMSRGIIKQGIPIVTSGPLQGREHLIRRIDRHKRTAEIEIPLEGRKQLVTVGLEIYEKQI